MQITSRYCTTLILLTVVLSSFGQYRTLEGIVTDQNGQALENITVTAKGTNLTTQTNASGFYKLDSVPDEILTLTFTHPDMQMASASIGIYDRIDVKIGTEADDITELSLEDLLNIEVTTASKTAQRSSDAPGAISILSRDEIERYGGVTLKDLLERIPGLIGSTVYMTDRSIIAARGDQVLASSSHVLLLIDGRPVREALEGGIKSDIYEAFPISIIERIEVVKGPGSVLYGSNAFSAVINVITKKIDGTTAQVSGMAGLPGNFGSSAHAMLKAGDAEFTLAGKYLKKQEWETDWEYADPNSASGSTTEKVTIPDEGKGLFLGINYKNARLMASYNEWQHAYFVSDYAFLFPARGDANWKKSFVDFGYGLQAAEKWDMDFNVTYTRSTFKTENWPGTNRDSYEMVGEWCNMLNPTNKLGIVFGGLFNYFEGDEWGYQETGDKIVFTDANRYSFGGYGQLNYALLSNLNVIGGIQLNKVEDIDLNAVPRAGLIWYPIERINVKAFYSSAFRAPSINEFSINFPDMMGNPGLTPEKVNTLDIGVGFNGEQMQLGMSFFYSQMMNLIFQNRDTSVVAVPMYWNGDEVDFMGVEVEAKYYINSEWYLNGSLLYQTNEDAEGNKNITPVSNLGIKAGLSYKSKNGITASLFNIYQGPLDDKFAAELNVSPGSYNYLNVYLDFDIFNLFDIGKQKGLSFFIQGQNLLNQEIWLPNWGLLPGTSIPVNQGLSLYFGLKLLL